MQKRVHMVAMFKSRLPYSEVAMHLRVAGKEMWMRLEGNGMVQLFDEDQNPFSIPITEGEAGVYRTENGYPYVVTED